MNPVSRKEEPRYCNHFLFDLDWSLYVQYVTFRDVMTRNSMEAG